MVKAAEHAAQTGLIITQAVSAIEQEKRENIGQEPGKEDATIL